jgi:hypothetical protein
MDHPILINQKIQVQLKNLKLFLRKRRNQKMIKIMPKQNQKNSLQIKQKIKNQTKRMNATKMILLMHVENLKRIHLINKKN